MHASALGKVILAFLPEPEVNRIINTHGLCRYNTNTISSASYLKEHLKMIRHRGFAFDNEEEELGFRHVAAPVFFGNHRVVTAAVDLTGTTKHITPENLPALADLAKQGADSISQLIYPAQPV
jgi:DNA-binding IclR family transcriptional regulator